MSLPVILDSGVPSSGPPERYRLPFRPAQLLLVCPTRLAGCVAFLREDHTLRRITFGAGELHVTDVAERYFQVVSGGQLSPVAPGPFAQACVYLQSRRLVVYDIARKRHAGWIITDMRNLEEVAAAAAWVSVEPGVVAVQIEDTRRYDEGIVDYRLRSFDVSGGAAVPLGVLELGAAPPLDFHWHAGQGCVFAARGGRVDAVGADLVTPAEHPLVPLAQELLGEAAGELVGMRVHPTRPWAALAVRKGAAGGKPRFHLFVATWGEDGPRRTHVASAPPGSRLQLGDFSHGGEHLAFWVDVLAERQLYLLPTGAEPTGPVRLGSASGVRACCWTRAPDAFVVFDGQGSVFRWRL